MRKKFKHEMLLFTLLICGTIAVKKVNLASKAYTEKSGSYLATMPFIAKQISVIYLKHLVQ